MRTKTLALSAMLGLLGSASLMAQSTNVYSLNAVGYINVTLYTGFNLISCPLICSPDNTLGTLLPNGYGSTTNTPENRWTVYQYSPAITNFISDEAQSKVALANGYTNGSITLNPGQGMWLQIPGGTTNVTFVGTVPQNGSPFLTNVLSPGFNMVSSAVPMNGDLTVNTNTLLTSFPAQSDQVYTYEPGSQTYDQTTSYSTKHGWIGESSNTADDPTTTNIAEAFWYQVNSPITSETWVENFSVNP
jgi:hypothetical protein